MLGFQIFDGGEDGAGFEKHSLASSAEVVVGFLMFVCSPVSEVVGVEVDDASSLCAFYDAFVEGC